MTEATLQDDQRIPLFGLVTTLLKNRWRIARWMVVGGVVAVAPVISKPVVYRATASFIPQGYEPGRSGLAGLAGQFGVSVSLGSGNQSLSPDFYVKLLKSRMLLQPIVRESFVVRELGSRRVPFMELFEIPEGRPAKREEIAVNSLSGAISHDINKATGVVEIGVVTPYPSLSLALAQALVDGINDYNQRVRQGQAASERRFIESRLSIATRELRDAEERLGRFLRTNRELGSSPELSMERDRLQREVGLRQQLFTSLTQALEDVRVREVRDTPVITMFEAPFVPSHPEPRGRFGRLMFGMMLGALTGIVLSFASAFMARRRRIGDPEATELVGTWHDLMRELMLPVRLVKRAVGR